MLLYAGVLNLNFTAAQAFRKRIHEDLFRHCFHHPRVFIRVGVRVGCVNVVDILAKPINVPGDAIETANVSCDRWVVLSGHVRRYCGVVVL